MANLPPRPTSGKVIPNDYWGRLWDYIKSTTVSGDGNTIKITETGGGKTISTITPIPDQKYVLPTPFEVTTNADGSGIVIGARRSDGTANYPWTDSISIMAAGGTYYKTILKLSSETFSGSICINLVSISIHYQTIIRI